MKDKKWDLAALASIPFIMTLGNSALIPILPKIGKKLGVSTFQVSMLITVYAVVAIILIPIAGYLSDRFGRKAIIIPSLAIAAIGGAISGLAAWFMTDGAAYWTIIGGRLLQGIGAAGAFPIVIPLVGDMFDDEKEVSASLGIIETSNTFGKVLSPIIGAALGAWLWYSPFLMIPTLCIISLLLVIFLVRTPKKHKEVPPLRQFLRSLKEVMVEKGRWLYAIFAVGCICMFVIFGVLFYLSEILESKYGIDGITKGFVLAIPLAMLCLSSFVSGKIIGSHKSRMKWIGFIGLVILTAALFTMGFSKSIYYVVGVFTVGGIGIGATLPCLDTLITEGVEKEHRGTITSLFSSMRFIGVSLGPPIISLLLNTSHFVLFSILAGVAAVGALLTLFAIKPKQNEGTGSGKNTGSKHYRLGGKSFIRIKRKA
ncbi:multidrug resistance protein [Paenibacillus sp. J45TS6]|uniref:MFS transporter n=1 Tax=Paenibacillus sp. J45TS6 TaxID=2807196 RepID=UPI001B179A83|nr:MFS transporter [Paenibacillus sp. J45TS6]GIP46020.1 multidrug resistance protein [Paenibacillus sp. J45TS6]